MIKMPSEAVQLAIVKALRDVAIVAIIGYGKKAIDSLELFDE